MTIWTPDLSRHQGPRYLAIADAIGAAITAGTLPGGAKLPPQRDLAWRLGVTVGTVSRAYMLAESRGLLSGEVGRGTFVRNSAAPAAAPLLAPSATGNIINLARNVPNATAASLEIALRGVFADLSQREGLVRLLQYMPDGGHIDHRAAGARWIGRVGLEVTPEQVVLTSGAQQAMSAVLASLARHGDTVLVERLTYGGFLDAARLFGLKVEGVALDDRGLDPAALNDAALRTGARLVLLQPTVHNPTSVTMDADRRAEIAQVARDRDLTIVEDDVYGFLPLDRPAPIATLAPERTIFIASASKCIAPGLRVGWIASPPALIERFANALHALSLGQPALTAEITRQWILDGTANRLTEELRQETEARQLLAAEILRPVPGLRLQGQPYASHVFVHLPEPWRREEFVAASEARGVRVTPATNFAVSRELVPHAVRLALTTAPDRPTLRRALTVLRDIIAAGPAGRRSEV
jgi:DNA-binding transcriptional MocR family regulator